MAPKAPKASKPTDSELRNTALGEGINLLNLRESGYEAVYDPNSKAYTFNKIPLTPEQQQQEAQSQELQTLAYNRLKGVADPATQKLVADTFQSQRDLGNQELTRYLGEQAGQRGLSLNDSPLARELGLQKSSLETGLRGAESASLLDVGQRQQLFGQALREFQQSLTQQSFANRAMIGQGAMNSGLTQMGNRYSIVGRQPLQSPFDMTMRGIGAAGGLFSGIGAGMMGFK